MQSKGWKKKCVSSKQQPAGLLGIQKPERSIQPILLTGENLFLSEIWSPVTEQTSVRDECVNSSSLKESGDLGPSSERAAVRHRLVGRWNSHGRRTASN